MSAPNKLSSLCAMINNEDRKSKTCKMEHKTNFVVCHHMSYTIPLLCKRNYISQTGRCIGVLLQEHADFLKANATVLHSVANADANRNLISVVC